MAEVVQRFFCHQCSMEIPTVGPDFTCPTCRSGFIEELVPETAPPAAQLEEDEADFDMGMEMEMAGPLAALLPGIGFGSRDFPGAGGGAGRRPRYHVYREGPLRPMRGRGPGPDTPSVEQFLQDIIFSVSGSLGGQVGPGFQLHLIPNNQGFHISGPGMQIHGNPGDYAWGRGGLDAIITQLLNQMDGAGPPPMAQENIQDIPTVGVSQVLLDKNPNCSVCWEDFKLEEQVKQLECQHCFHNDCIVPWLQLHGTCPVCRKVLSGDGDGRPESERLQGDRAAAGASGGAAGGQDEEEDEGEDNSSQPQHQPSGLAGLIQSAFQVLGGGGWSGQTRGAVSPTSTSTSTSTSSSSSSTSASSTQQQVTSRGTQHQARGEEEEGTPSTRRPRLDSDLLDLDLE